ncbi:hypothetical protein MAXJ12_22431 [Mesorhizobium alhagi CCNWXJ12-2]|uniref:Uncharacterized protein n=1 Tax=Mesorhizobium alhagi CCNWXJ12-2 TaxID=1107882 RepID=H0HWC6_9HYPH|nr:hypothetical protein MAXJ12_22431 [Mesorhizobium alhagi CCNWXJ12-2]
MVMLMGISHPPYDLYVTAFTAATTSPTFGSASFSRLAA